MLNTVVENNLPVVAFVAVLNGLTPVLGAAGLFLFRREIRRRDKEREHARSAARKWRMKMERNDKEQNDRLTELVQQSNAFRRAAQDAARAAKEFQAISDRLTTTNNAVGAAWRDIELLKETARETRADLNLLASRVSNLEGPRLLPEAQAS